MASTTADILEKMAEIKNRRLKKADASRKELAEQFPLLFTTDSVKKYSIKSLDLVAPSLKKIVQQHDENSNNTINTSIASTKTSTMIPFTSTTTTSNAPAVTKSSYRVIAKPKTPLKSTNTTNGNKTIVSPKRERVKKHSKKAKKIAAERALQLLKEKESVTNEEIVQDVLECMLDVNEINRSTFKRLSGERFSIDKLRRLSVDGMHALSATEVNEISLNANTVDEAVAGVNDEVAITAAEEAEISSMKEGDKEEEVNSHLAVLMALRTYIKFMNESNDKPIDDMEEVADVVTLSPAAAVTDAPEVITTNDMGIDSTHESLLTALKGDKVTFHIDKYIEINDHIEYELSYSIDGNQCTSTCKRYSDFVALHAYISSTATAVHVPALPEKQMFAGLYSRWKDDTFVRDRVIRLNEWMNAVFSQSSSMNLSQLLFVIDNFLQAKKPRNGNALAPRPLI